MKKVYTLVFCLYCTFAGTAFSQVLRRVAAVNFVFVPANFSAVVGDTIRFTFGNGLTPGGFPHTTTSTSIPAGAAAWDHPLVATDSVFTYVVTASGQYAFKCTPHEGRGMVGQFLVSATAPVKMTGFSSSLVDGKAKLTWQTASEENADHFSIQQSSDGTNFAEIGTVPAAGNSQSVRNYTYAVNTIPGSAAYLYFRILTIDKDKKEQYSDIILLHLPKAAEARFIKNMYPNPAENGDHLHFDFNSESSGKLDVIIFETTGKQIFTMPLTAVEGRNQTHMPLPRLRKGSYFIQFMLGDKKQTLPLFVK